jgi:hypothetical protein
VVCLAPRAPGHSVRPRRLVGAFGRPLNFTVRSHFGEIQRPEERGAPSFGARVCELQLTRSPCRRLRSALPSARAAKCSLRLRSGRAPRTLPRGGGGIGPRGLFGCRSGALSLGVWCLRLPVVRRTRTVVICEGDF